MVVDDGDAAVETTRLLSHDVSRTQAQRCRTISNCKIALVGFVAIVAVISSIRLHRNNDAQNNILYGSSHHTSYVFPPNFMWGAATSAYQIEGGASAGGRGPSIWDTWCVQSSDNCHGDTGEISDDHYHFWREDIELMRSLGLKAYRFSISWSRILPEGTADGGINYEGIDFYNGIIDLLLEYDIEPFVTLYHWDLPQALQERYGGWVNRSIIQDFGEYARICFHHFGDRVKYWITINEGWTTAIHGYEEGSKAPGLIGIDVGGTGDPYLVGHHLLLAHARAVKVFRKDGYARLYQRGKKDEYGLIGISNSGDYRFPLNPSSKDDQEAATRSMEFQLGWMVSREGDSFCSSISA